MKRSCLMAIIILMFADCGWASLMSGTLDSSNGMNSNGAFNGSTLAWSIDQVNGKWVYTYTFTPTGANRGAAYFNIELGAVPPIGDLTWSITSPGTSPPINNSNTSLALQNATLDNRPQYPARQYGTSPNFTYVPKFQGGTADFGLPPATDSIAVSSTISGDRWSLPLAAGTDTYTLIYSQGGTPTTVYSHSGYDSPFTLTITTSLSPMWGSFFADGQTWTNDHGYLLARNSNYGSSSRPGFVLGSNQTGWIATPGAPAAPVPALQPVTFVLLFSLLLGVLAYRQRRGSRHLTL
jgi:hypothetical protein